MSFGSGTICVMGSGETAPTMVKVHRRLLSDANVKSAGEAVFLDTPFGFQENADELSSKALAYFETSLQTTFDIATLRNYDDATSVARESFLEQIRQAKYIFAGPGSPTYALSNWENLHLGDVLREKITNGATVVFSSAAALTLGSFTIPVYEIYKVGMRPQWRTGLGVFGLLGLNAAVVPHYNNQEGGHHDTRFCYMGEPRLALLEQSLPDDAIVIGIDEHTGITINCETEVIDVVGNGVLTLRKAGHSITFQAGERLKIGDLADFAKRDGRASLTSPDAVEEREIEPQEASAPESSMNPLSQSIADHVEGFDAALESKDPLKATEIVLDLESELQLWSADTLQSDDLTRGREALRNMILRLGQLGVGGVRDVSAIIAPYVDTLLELRTYFRESKEYQRSDDIRDLLIASKIEVKDTKDGSIWHLECDE